MKKKGGGGIGPLQSSCSTPALLRKELYITPMRKKMLTIPSITLNEAETQAPSPTSPKHTSTNSLHPNSPDKNNLNNKFHYPPNPLTKRLSFQKLPVNDKEKPSLLNTPVSLFPPLHSRTRNSILVFSGNLPPIPNNFK